MAQEKPVLRPGAATATVEHDKHDDDLVSDRPQTDDEKGKTAAQKIIEGVENDTISTDQEGKLQPPEAAAVVEDATQWMLAQFETQQAVEHEIDLNVGTAKNPSWIKWKIKAVDGAELRRIRARSMEAVDDRRRQTDRQASSEAVYQANVEVVVAGTVEPDLLAAAQAKGLMVPNLMVELVFRHKQGLIDQLSSEIMSLSGYDDEDVRDHVEVRAASSS